VSALEPLARITRRLRGAAAGARIEELLRESEERYRCIAETANDVVWSLDAEGRMELLSGTASELFGYPVEELIGRPFAELMAPDRLDGALERFARVLAGETVRGFESRVRSRDGSIIDVVINATAHRDRDGRMHVVGTTSDVSARMRAERELRFLADHDTLTDLFNRRRFEEELRRQLDRAARYAETGAVLVLDLDNFKFANDSFGHRAGDTVIRIVARRLSERLRQSDVLARIGGDEFAILLPHADAGSATRVAEDLLATVREAPVVLDAESGRAVHLTASLGVALFAGGHPAEHDVLALADAAMYEAKERGRNGIALYDAQAGRQEALARNVALVERLREALEGDGFELHAQPILDLSTRQLTHSEVLLRLRGADGELIPPGDFLPLAESFGLMPNIDRWVVHEAIALAAEQQAAGIDVRLEVNLSAQSLGDRCMLAAIESELERLGVDPARLIFEVTETAAIANFEHAREFIERLRAIGCSFALDDFGAGYGSFRYLKHLPFDYLKIDGEFIRDLPRDESDRHVVQSLVAAARGLDKRVVAEFVADDETIELLSGMGVDYAQGFHIARPAPIRRAGEPRLA
jgi:diguanylate cyclase (GGDEF)-like protein/PAS domain S-box-containing protein